MTIKFIIILVVIAVAIFILSQLINSAKNSIEEKIENNESLIQKQHTELVEMLKKEMASNYNKYKTSTNDMIQQFRIMNSMEKQHITMLSDDYVEMETENVNLNMGTNDSKEPTKLYMSETTGTNNVEYITTRLTNPTKSQLSGQNMSDSDSSKLSQKFNKSKSQEKSQSRSQTKSQEKSQEKSQDISQEITLGNTNKCETVVLRTGKNTVVDDLSLNTNDVKLMTINNYTKSSLEEMAKEHNIEIPPKATKNIIYAKLKEVML
jgi:hypothetical protein